MGLAFYSPEEWEALRTAVPDPEALEDTYDEWLAVYRDGVAKLRASGFRPKRVDIRLDRFQDWWRRNGRRPDGAARAAYAADLLRRFSIEGFVLSDA
jgi:hypothetical protein